VRPTLFHLSMRPHELIVPPPRRAGGTVLPSGSLVPSPFPAFMDGAWPNVLDRIAQLGVYDVYSGGEGEGKGKERGPNHVRALAG